MEEIKAIDINWLGEKQIREILKDPDKMAKLAHELNTPNVREKLFWKQLGNNYSKNDKYVFYKNQELKWADAETFENMWYDYAKDKNNVYHYGNIFYWWLVDRLKADSATFEVYEWWLAMDRNYVYIHWTTVMYKLFWYDPLEPNLIRKAMGKPEIKPDIEERKKAKK